MDWLFVYTFMVFQVVVQDILEALPAASLLLAVTVQKDPDCQ